MNEASWFSFHFDSCVTRTCYVAFSLILYLDLPLRPFIQPCLLSSVSLFQLLFPAIVYHLYFPCIYFVCQPQVSRATFLGHDNSSLKELICVGCFPFETFV